MWFTLLLLLGWTTGEPCPTGLIRCPPDSPSSGVCVATADWCAKPRYLNPFAGLHERVDDLLPRMTLQQKINYLQTDPEVPADIPELNLARFAIAECLHGYCGRSPSTLFPQSMTLAASFHPSLIKEVAAAIGMEARAWRNQWDSKYSLNSQNTHNDPPPPPPGLTCFSPQINIVRDGRWGRGQETYGEEPTLTAAMATSYVQGLQGNDSFFLLAAAETKHWNAYQGASTRGLYSPTEIYVSWRDEIEIFFPAWEAVTRQGHTAGVMTAYNTICHDDTNATCFDTYGLSHGVPMTANQELNQGWLRGRWNWTGFLGGDCGAVQFVETDHRWAPSQDTAAAASLLAGTDFDCSVAQGKGFGALMNATRKGLVIQSDIDRALSRIIQVHIRLGLLNPPEFNPYSKVPMSVVNSAEHRALALRAAREGIVLLRNAQRDTTKGGKPWLPLDASSIGRVLVTGPTADLVQSGNYNSETDRNVTIWQGLYHTLGSRALFLKGCENVTSNSTQGISDVVKAAQDAEIVIAVVGIDPTVEYEDSTRPSFELPGAQSILLTRLLDAGASVVIIITGGSCVNLPDRVVAQAKAILWAGYGGEEAGNAVSDVLFGHHNPSGRLPITFVRDVRDLPPYHNMTMISPPFGRTVRYFNGTPLFRFGEGYSYSTFSVYGIQAEATKPLTQGSQTETENESENGKNEIEKNEVVVDKYFQPWAEATVSRSSSNNKSKSSTSQPHSESVLQLSVCSWVNITVTVENMGPYPGDDVTLLFVQLPNATHQTPLHSLQGFTRSWYNVSQRHTIQFTLSPRNMAVVVNDESTGFRGWVVEPGVVRVWVGSRQPRHYGSQPNATADDEQFISFSLVGESTSLSRC